MIYGKWSLLRCKVSFPRPHARILHPTHLHSDLTKATVASFIRRIVAQAVLRANLVGYFSKGGPRLFHAAGGESFSSGCTRHLAHFFPRQIVELPADVHAFELSQAAKVLIVFLLRLRRKELAKPL